MATTGKLASFYSTYSFLQFCLYSKPAHSH
uniref:Uncharacterized protein n=1 Tax=Anguilla anguilla TaxID=7936 RepID=A0A0E9UZK2_ANGAN